MNPPMDKAMENMPAAAPAAPPVSPAARTAAKAKLVYKHSLAIRWFHWINFPVLFVMIWSGILILWANDVYPVENPVMVMGRKVSLRVRVPERISVYKWGVKPVYGDTPNAENAPAPPEQRYDFQLGTRLSEGMAWHFTLAWLFTLNGVAYFLFLIFSGEWRLLAPRLNSLSEAFQVVLHDLKIRKKPLPPAKFNHAQRIAYSGVLALGFVMVWTGLAIYKPANMAWLSLPFGGYQGARTVHFLVTCLFLAFFLVHIWQVIQAGWNNFRAMVTGYEVERTSPAVEGTK